MGSRRMRIVVNAVAARLGGGVRQLNPFLAGLADQLPEAAFEIYVTPEFPDPIDHDRLHWEIVELPRGVRPSRVYWDNVTLPRLSVSADLLLSPLNFGPLRIGRPHILFERNALYFDPVFYASQPLRTRTRLAAFRRYASITARGADRIIVPSHTMKNLLSRHVRRSAQIMVIPHGFDAPRAREQSLGRCVDGATPWARHGLKMLHVGHPGQHKNLDLLVDVLADVVERAPQRDPGLAVTFRSDDSTPTIAAFAERARARGVIDRITFLGSVPQHAVYPLYRTASVFLFPSFTESFGFPLLEALAAGTAVVASDISSNRETAVDHAQYHPPRDASRAADLVLAASTTPELQAARFARAAEFSWEAHCSEVAALIRQLVAGNSPAA